MDAGFVNALIATRVAQAQLAAAGRIVRMNAGNTASVLALVNSAQLNTALFAALPGTGIFVDFTV